MNRRPLIVFTLCWLAGAASAQVYGGLRLAAVLVGLTLLLAAAVLFTRTSAKLLLIFGLALGSAAGYGLLREAGSLSVLPERLGVSTGEADGYSGIRIEGRMAGPAKIDGDLAQFVLKAERVLEQTDPLPGETPGGADGKPGSAVPDEAGRSEAKPAAFGPLSHAEKVVVRVKLAAETEQETAASWQRGDLLIVYGDLEAPSGARNFGAFDYRDYLRNQRIHWIVKAAGASSVETADAASGGLQLLRRSDDLRTKLADTLAKLYPGIGAGYMQGLLLGLQEGLDPDTYTNFVRLGMTHVLAISGMHVGLYVGALLLALRRLRVSKESSLLAALYFVPPYVLLTGSSPSAVRAGIMAMIGLYAAKRGWLKDGLHILCLAALLMLIWDPHYLTSISFQLSFAVTAGIILLTRPMRQLLFFLPKALAGAAAISLVADLVSFPLSIYYFNQYPLLGLAANLVLVPLISFVSIPLGTVSLMLGTFWMQGAEWAAYPVRLVNAAVFWCAQSGGSVRFARTIWASPPPVWILMYEAALIGGLFALAAHLAARRPDPSADGRHGGIPGFPAHRPLPGDTMPLGPLPGEMRSQAGSGKSFAPSVRYGVDPSRRRTVIRLALGALSGLLLAGMVGAAYAPRPDPAGLVQMLDVGQGDAILVTTPTGKNLLVDGGGTVTFERPGEAWRRRLDPYEVGRDVVVPLLKKRGIHRLDAVILTHGDRDHYGGLLAVLDEIPADRLIMNGTRSGGEDLDALLASALRFGAEIDAPQNGDIWKADEATSLEFLNPSGVFAGTVPELEEQNEYSVVFRLAMNGHSFLFTGDIGLQAERDILDRLEERGDGGKVEVLKVGHHGSKNSSSDEWIGAWSPRLSLISVGAKNTYGHPNPGVIQRLELAGSAVLRTDRDGEIQISAPRGEPLRYRTRLDGRANPVEASD
ncbi:ComEC/Rec2 family competence protein [Saccharibacillus deserti]|uniref:ComEC/Rec2 family competence protein n=1 Tax=Saccharibacillus deserti TaxID=1634444 RepID=UPI001554FEDE|nr:ComEC/Rec2 family competence protein [Saccharibacillus deserti]